MSPDRPFRPLGLLALLSGLALSACGPKLPQELNLRAETGARRYATGETKGEAPGGLRFPRPPESRAVVIDGESRRAVLTSTETWSWRGKIGPASAIHAGVQILPEQWPSVTRFSAWVEAESGGKTEILDVAHLGARRLRAPQRWLELDSDLSRFAGREIRLTFHVEAEGLPAGAAGKPVIAWAPVRLSRARPEEEAPRERPNVLFLVVDTLRHDHLTPYGYRRDTSPNLARLLAARGVVAESAYSQAPWTLPSVVSFLTSRYPGEILGSDSATYGIPPAVPSLAEEMEKLGYETGGFIANKVLHAGNGFERGFSTFFNPPAEVPEGEVPDASALADRMGPWLAAHRDAPFFLYAHFMDPHDPYVNPEIVNGRSPYFPDYQGEISGYHIHGLHTGKIPLADPENDVAQVNALYDSEIHYADRFLGELIESLPPAVLRNTLIVLTADHGEEIYDHGGWKHGFTLYEELIHVPLLLRWDGRLPAGTRLPGVVRLLDLAPTLLRAAGGTPPASWEGVDLLPALAKKAPLPRLTAFAQHMMIGPLRAAAVHEGSKLILFNPRTPFAPADDLQKHLWNLDLQRLQRVELYDLAKDPREKTNLAPGAGSAERIARLQPALHQQLDRQMPGLRVIARGLPAGVRLQGEMEIAAPASSGGKPEPLVWQSYFLAAGDQVEVAGRKVRFDLGGEALDKGFFLLGGIGSIENLKVALDGRSLPPDRLRLGSGAPYNGGKIEAGTLLSEGWPSSTEVGLRIWLPRGPREPPAGGAGAEANAETQKRLRALGYIQ